MLLLDEPLSALDAKVRVQLREEIRRIQLELGITTLYVTHDQEEALSISDRVAVMWNGKIEQIGSPAEMYGNPATPFVAEFIGTMNRLTATVADDGAIDYEGLRLAVDAARGLPRGERVLCLLRPEDVSVVVADGGTHDGALTGDVVSRIFLGAVTRVRVEDGERSLVADLSTARAAPLAVGAQGRRELRAEQPPPAGAQPRTHCRPCSTRTIREDPVHAERGERSHPVGVVHRVDGRRKAEPPGLRKPAAGDPRVPEPDAPRIRRRGADGHAEPHVLEHTEVGPATLHLEQRPAREGQHDVV